MNRHYVPCVTIKKFKLTCGTHRHKTRVGQPRTSDGHGSPVPLQRLLGVADVGASREARDRKAPTP
jgi:hypothetical protein